ncbi:hypothetical protein L6452_39865 [Arctium lappa]|uniref:Uncharacterized protein n=1 Tax=Arctium lappa TaxID=4217 RepID=A0ACB8XTY8_ARCLA|nr:hypothetical protein L6452_39865 [Arctium lappa]
MRPAYACAGRNKTVSGAGMLMQRVSTKRTISCTVDWDVTSWLTKSLETGNLSRVLRMIVYCAFIMAPGQCHGEPTCYICILDLPREDDRWGSEKFLSELAKKGLMDISRSPGSDN